MQVSTLVAVIAAVVALAGVILQYLNNRVWEARRWTREARFPQYTAFIQAAESYFPLLHDRERSIGEIRETLSGAEMERIQSEMRIALAGIRMLGPAKTAELALLLNNILYAWDRGHPIGTSNVSLKDFDHFASEYRRVRKDFLESAQNVFTH